MSSKNKRSTSPPHIATRFLRWYCRADLVDEVEGDLYELFQKRVEEQRVWKAKALYWLNVLMFLHPDYIRKRKENYSPNHTAMFRNYFKVAIRNLIKSKFYAILNVLGLATGIAACLIISFYVMHELSYDRYHTDVDRLYRVAVDIRSAEGNRVFARTSGPLAPALEKDFPQVETATRLWQWNDVRVKYGEENIFYENNYYIVDPSVFDVFTIPLIRGDANTALNRPNTIVIAEETAKKYFGQEDPLGKILQINDKAFEVSGVMQQLAYNSHLKFNLLTSFATFNNETWFEEDIQNWHSTMYYTYIKVADHVDMASFERQIETAANAYVGELIKDWGYAYHYFLQPVKRIHLHSDISAEAEVPGSAVNVYIFTVVAVLILLIASLNYINHTTAQSSRRAKEIGVRKAIGADRTGIFSQFVSETLLLTFLALLVALLMVFATYPVFEQLSGQTYQLTQIFTPQYIGIVIGLTWLLGVAAAIYPALFLSSFRPVAVLKGKLSRVEGSALRKVLVICQFTISIMLMVGSMTVYRQLSFMKNQHLGFDKEQTLILPLRGGVSIADRLEQVRGAFQGHSSVLSMTASSSVPGKGVDNFSASVLGEADDKGQSMYYLFVDFDFLETYGIDMVAGRPFNREFQTDAGSAFLVNEKVVSAFGWATPEEAIGKKLSAGFGREGVIMGVYKDFHYRSLQTPIEPLILAIVPWRFHYISLKLNTAELPATMAFVEKQWQELFPENPFDYSFLDEEFDRQYTADERMSKTVLVFTGIAIFIACLGLFGLATFVAQQRTKEIGIRKVMGASVPGLVKLLSKDFVRLVLFALLIASPISWWVMHQWLQDFAYRIDIEWWMFAVAGLMVVAIALATVSFQSIKAALANPVDSLRNE